MDNTPSNSINNGETVPTDFTTSGQLGDGRVSAHSFMEKVMMKQRMCFTVTLATPIQGVSSPIFAIAVQPTIFTPHIYDENWSSVADHTTQYYNHPCWIYQEAQPDDLDPTRPGTTPPLRGVCCVQYDKEPILSRYSKLTRFWRGSISYTVRTTGKVTDMGAFSWNMIEGTTRKKTYPARWPEGGNVPMLWGEPSPYTSLHDAEAQGYQRFDMAEKRHANINISFHRALPFTDRALDDMVAAIPQTDQFIVLRLDGICSSGDNNPIEFQIEYQAGPDYACYQPIYPFIVNPLRVKNFYSSWPQTQQYWVAENFWDPSFTSFGFGDRNLMNAEWRMSRRAEQNYTKYYRGVEDPWLGFYIGVNPDEDTVEEKMSPRASGLGVKNITKSFEKLNVLGR